MFIDVMPKELIMKKSAAILTTVAALALTAIASPKPAEARGFGRGIAGGLIAGAVVAGVASSAYAMAPEDGYYGGQSYYAGPAYRGASPYGYPYGGYGDQSQHGGQPYYGR
jgi:hypothetical protein